MGVVDLCNSRNDWSTSKMSAPNSARFRPTFLWCRRQNVDNICQLSVNWRVRQKNISVIQRRRSVTKFEGPSPRAIREPTHCRPNSVSHCTVRLMYIASRDFGATSTLVSPLLHILRDLSPASPPPTQDRRSWCQTLE